MNDKKFDLTTLLPNFGSLKVPPEAPDQLSALFVSVLLVIFVGFLLVAIFSLLASLSRISWISTLLKNETSSSLASNRQNFIEKSKQVKHLGGHLWLEFDETLIEVERDGSVNLYNTLEADHFFNNSTLARGITESRMLAAVPGFLTAIGVIGTFVGLQLGLAKLPPLGGGDSKALIDGLTGVIAGASIAFITSVWGVSLSVLFNFIEKGLERIARTSINRLQTRIDQLFPRLSVEFQLHQIAEDGQESRKSLQGLAEKIGEKLQESLLEVTDRIQAGLESSLQKIMAPAINKLVDETSDGNQKALEILVNKFLSQFGELGNNQRNAMDIASQKVSDALGSLNSSMTSFLDKLEVSQGNSADRERELITTISNQVSQLVDHSIEQRKLLTEFVDKQLGGLSKLFQERERKTSELDRHRQEVFIDQIGTINSSTEALLHRVERGMEEQLAASDLLIEQGRQLQISIDESVRAGVEASAGLKASANELNSASQEIKLFGAHIRDAGNSLSDAVINAVESTSGLAQQNQLASQLVEEQRQQLVDDRQQFMQATERLQSLINSADSSFDKMREHQDVFVKELKDNVSDLAKQMTDLLNEYAERANAQTARHLEVWAQSTTNYAERMNNAAQALSRVVDEIDQKLGQ